VTTYFSSDWHLDHVNIIRYCDRPFKDVDEMNAAIIDNCNELVGEDDTLILLGDHALGRYPDSILKLRALRAGVLILAPGNHDRWSLAYRQPNEERREYHREQVDLMLRPHFKEVVVMRDQAPSAWGYGRGKAGHPRCAMSHYPYSGDSGDKDRHVGLRPLDEGLPLLHGHVHEKWQLNGRQMNVGVDVWDFKPVSEHAIRTWIDTLDLPERSSLV
jgi:calcineurin-like phosphoesterase family protein